jgi:hypothetical protein
MDTQREQLKFKKEVEAQTADNSPKIGFRLDPKREHYEDEDTDYEDEDEDYENEDLEEEENGKSRKDFFKYITNKAKKLFF